MTSEHRLSLAPNGLSEDGFFLTSNGRTWGMSRAMLEELSGAISHVLNTGTEFRNYEEPKREPVLTQAPSTPKKAKPSLDDILGMI
jgi:hypothetical protein